MSLSSNDKRCQNWFCSMVDRSSNVSLQKTCITKFYEKIAISLLQKLCEIYVLSILEALLVPLVMSEPYNANIN